MLSEAFPAKSIAEEVVVYVGLEVGEVMLIAGGIVSAALNVTASKSVAAFPVASLAVIPIVFCTPEINGMLASQFVEAAPGFDIVAVPVPPAELAQVTCVTPTLSVAVPPMAKGVEVAV